MNKFTSLELNACMDRMCQLSDPFTDNFRDFVLDCFADGMGEDFDCPEFFIQACQECYDEQNAHELEQEANRK